MNNGKCYFCGETVTGSIERNGHYRFVDCPVCGKYEHMIQPTVFGSECKDIVAAFLFHNRLVEAKKPSSKAIWLGEKADYYEEKGTDAKWRHVSLEEIKHFYPQTFSERIERILLAIESQTNYFGEILSYSVNEYKSLLFMQRYHVNGAELRTEKLNYQYRNMRNYLDEQMQYLDIGNSGNGVVHVSLLPNGWQRIEELQKSQSNNKNVFVSMAFNDGTKPAREAIRKGIVDAGYSPNFIDEIIHNRQIVPEMFRLIRECRFLILDISDPNYGAYYEAGYALGLGKEVIISCSQEVFSKQPETEEEKKYAKYLRPHFDIAQKQILIWNDTSDLSKKLTEWIKAIVG